MEICSLSWDINHVDWMGSRQVLPSVAVLKHYQIVISYQGLNLYNYSSCPSPNEHSLMKENLMNNQFALIAQTISIWQYILSSFPWWEAWHTEVRWLFPGCSPPQSHVKVKFSAPWWFILSHTWVNHCLSTWMFIARQLLHIILDVICLPVGLTLCDNL